MAIGKEFFSLEEKIGYKFKDIKLLETAMTHASYSNEKKSLGMNFSSNERLEFLGDSVLEIVISRYLYDNYKNRAEGCLTKMRQYLVCEKTLAKIAGEINLGDYLNLGKGEEKTDCRNRKKVLADALEALFAALYLDGGEGSSDYKELILSLMKEEIECASEMEKGDYKTMLQQLVEKDGAAELVYEVESESGPEHDKTFTVKAVINNNTVGVGTSKSKKDAEMQAAREALRLFGVII